MTHPTRTASLLALSMGLALASPAAFAKKKKGDDAAAAAPSGPDLSAMKTPDDANSKKFGEQLVTANIANFKPSDGGGAKLEYTTLSFNPDNTWTAQAYIEIQDERMDCTESGLWSMEAAESANTAMVTWSLDKTDCPGREAGGELRAVITLGKGGIQDIKFR